LTLRIQKEGQKRKRGREINSPKEAKKRRKRRVLPKRTAAPRDADRCRAGGPQREGDSSWMGTFLLKKSLKSRDARA